MDNQEIKELLEQLSNKAVNGGSHIATVRMWMQRTFRNGDRVTWGGDTPLTGTHLLPRELEALSVEIAQAVIKEVEQYLLRRCHDGTA